MSRGVLKEASSSLEHYTCKSFSSQLELELGDVLVTARSGQACPQKTVGCLCHPYVLRHGTGLIHGPDLEKTGNKGVKSNPDQV